MDLQLCGQMNAASTSMYEATLTKAAGRSLDGPRELLSSDPQDGKLPQNILSAIAKLQGECKAFVSA